MGIYQTHSSPNIYQILLDIFGKGLLISLIYLTRSFKIKSGQINLIQS